MNKEVKNKIYLMEAVSRAYEQISMDTDVRSEKIQIWRGYDPYTKKVQITVVGKPQEIRLIYPRVFDIANYDGDSYIVTIRDNDGLTSDHCFIAMPDYQVGSILWFLIKKNAFQVAHEWRLGWRPQDADRVHVDNNMLLTELYRI